MVFISLLGQYSVGTENGFTSISTYLYIEELIPRFWFVSVRSNKRDIFKHTLEDYLLKTSLLDQSNFSWKGKKKREFKIEHIFLHCIRQRNYSNHHKSQSFNWCLKETRF